MWTEPNEIVEQLMQAAASTEAPRAQGRGCNGVDIAGIFRWGRMTAI